MEAFDDFQDKLEAIIKEESEKENEVSMMPNLDSLRAEFFRGNINI